MQGVLGTVVQSHFGEIEHNTLPEYLNSGDLEKAAGVLSRLFDIKAGSSGSVVSLEFGLSNYGLLAYPMPGGALLMVAIEEDGAQPGVEEEIGKILAGFE